MSIYLGTQRITPPNVDKIYIGVLVYEKYYQLGESYDMTKFNEDGSTEFDLDRVDMVKAQASAIAQDGDRWAVYQNDSYVTAAGDFSINSYAMQNIVKPRRGGQFYFIIIPG